MAKKFPDLDGFFPGAKWKPKKGVALARVMGTVEEYVVARFAYCIPFVQHYRDFLDNFDRAAAFDPKPKRSS